MPQDRDLLMLFWAKLRRDRNAPSAFHPLLCHMIDVAMVAHAMWRTVLPAQARQNIALTFGIDEDAAGRWVAFLAGDHDTGKASPAFQLQDKSTRVRILNAGLFCPTQIPEAPHGTITTSTLRTWG